MILDQHDPTQHARSGPHGGDLLEVLLVLDLLARLLLLGLELGELDLHVLVAAGVSRSSRARSSRREGGRGVWERNVGRIDA
jgi:hypothetical protein